MTIDHLNNILTGILKDREHSYYETGADALWNLIKELGGPSAQREFEDLHEGMITFNNPDTEDFFNQQFMSKVFDESLEQFFMEFQMEPCLRAESLDYLRGLFELYENLSRSVMGRLPQDGDSIDEFNRKELVKAALGFVTLHFYIAGRALPFVQENYKIKDFLIYGSFDKYTLDTIKTLAHFTYNILREKTGGLPKSTVFDTSVENNVTNTLSSVIGNDDRMKLLTLIPSLITDLAEGRDTKISVDSFKDKLRDLGY